MILASISNAIEQDGIAMSLTGMFIVFVALSLISLFIAVLPWILKIVSTVFPEPVPHRINVPDPKTNAVGDEQLAIAISAAMHANRTNA